MKKLFFILLLGCCFACKKDSNPANSGTDKLASLIVGNWTTVSDKYTVVDKTGKETVVGTDAVTGDYIIFNANGTGSEKEGAGIRSFTYSVNSNNAISITFSGSNPWNIPVNSITSNNLSLRFSIGPSLSDGHTEIHDMTYKK